MHFKTTDFSNIQYQENLRLFNFFFDLILCLKDKGVHVIHYWYLTLSLSIAVLMYTPN